MIDEFELEHWKSRATLAEQERDSARSVLAALRSFHRDPSPEHAARLLARRKEHDVTWWNVEHAMAAASEAIEDVKLGRPIAVVSQPQQHDTTGTEPALVARAVDASMRVVDKWLKDQENGAVVSDGKVRLHLQSLYNLAGLCLYLGLEQPDARHGDE